jgi:hypothetical protein
MALLDTDDTVTADEPVLVLIEPHMLQAGWPHIGPMLEQACADSRGQFNVATILANLENWPILGIVKGGKLQAVMVTCIVQLEGRRVLDCLLATGDQAKQWPAVDDAFDDFARQFGCSSVRIPCARKGWAKALPHWRIVGYVMEREI